MLKDKYKIVDVGNGFFELFLGAEQLTSFRRETFREKLEHVAEQKCLSSNWIGSILRIFLKQCPPASPADKPRSDLDRLLDKVGIEGIAELLRQDGMRVRKKIKVSQIDMIRLLEKHDYEINGFIGDVHYDTCELQKAVSSC